MGLISLPPCSKQFTLLNSLFITNTPSPSAYANRSSLPPFHFNLAPLELLEGLENERGVGHDDGGEG